jgi:hypothetical protein
MAEFVSKPGAILLCQVSKALKTWFLDEIVEKILGI